MNTTINIRIDEKIKKEAKKNFEEMGLDLTTGIKIFLKTVNRTKKIPFEILTENGYTEKFEEEVLKDLEWTKKHGKTYNNFNEILKEIDKEIKAEKNV